MRRAPAFPRSLWQEPSLMTSRTSNSHCRVATRFCGAAVSMCSTLLAPVFRQSVQTRCAQSLERWQDLNSSLGSARGRTTLCRTVGGRRSGCGHRRKLRRCVRAGTPRPCAGTIPQIPAFGADIKPCPNALEPLWKEGDIFSVSIYQPEAVVPSGPCNPVILLRYPFLSCTTPMIHRGG